MKMDKQTLAKHHFWILLGVFGLFALVLIILVPVLIGAEIEDKDREIKKINSDLDTSSQNPTMRGYLQAQEEQKKTLGARIGTIWRDMYRRQGGILTFPTALANKLDELNFGAEIDDRNREAYRSDDVYRAAYSNMSSIIKPTEYEGSWEQVLQPATFKLLPSSEEVWLSLEDLCVRRQILNILDEANKTGARFVEVKDAKDLPKSKTMGANFSKRWVSRDYQLDLVIEQKGVGRYAFGGKLKNIGTRRLSTGEFSIDVRLTPDLADNEPAKPVTVHFPIDPVAAGQETDLKVIELQPNLSPVDIFSVELHQTLQTVPIKRLMQLVLGKNAGHRMADRKSEMAKFSVPPVDPNAPAAAPQPNQGNGPGLRPGAGGLGGMGGGSGATDNSATLNGVNRARYVEITDQVRRMPVAVVLVIDQLYLQDVLAAFSNSSQLRFQITQYHWQRYYAPIVLSNDPGNSRPSSPSGPSAPAGSSSGGMGIVGGGGGGGATNPGTASKKTGDQVSVSLVEVTVYGIANLYERPAKTTEVSAESEPKTPTPAPEAPAPGKPADASKPGGEQLKSPDASKPASTDKQAGPASDKPADSTAEKPKDAKLPEKPNRSGSPDPAKPKDGAVDKPKG